MNFFKKTIVLLVLIVISSATQVVDPTEGITYRWTRDITQEWKKNGHADDPPIFDILAGEDYHSLALLKCKDFTAKYLENCNLTVQTHTFDSAIHKTICNIVPPSKQETRETTIDGVTFLKKDRVLVAWKENHKLFRWRMNYQVISIDTCKASESIHVNTWDEPTKSHPILRYDHHFDIVFFDKYTCHNHHYCTISHYYDGTSKNSIPNPLTSRYVPEHENLTLNEVYVVDRPDENQVVLVAERDKSFSEIEHIYSPFMGWIEIEGAMFRMHSYSNTSGHATFCWSSHNKKNGISCKWLDGTHGHETMRLDFSKPFKTLPFTYNKPDGSILLVRAGLNDQKNNTLFIDEGNSNGKCKRLVQTIIHDIPLRVQLSIIDDDTYCFSYVGGKHADQVVKNTPVLVHHTFVTRCVKTLDKHEQTYFECSKRGYYW